MNVVAFKKPLVKSKPKSSPSRTIGVYKSYNFKDKDPVIDILRRLIEIEVGVSRTNWSYVLKEVERLSGVPRTTLYNWFNGPTRRPSFAAVNAVARALGKSFKLGKK